MKTGTTNHKRLRERASGETIATTYKRNAQRQNNVENENRKILESEKK